MSADVHSIENSIDTAWELRFARKIRETELELDRIKKKSESVSFPREIRWQIRLLDVSLHRALGDITSARECIDSIGAELKSETSIPFQYYLQKALNFFATDQFVEALELFFQASTVAVNDSERFYAKMNALICLDNLHLPSGDILSQLLGLTERLDEKTKKSLAVPLRHLTGYQLRQSFRNGDFKSVQNAPKSDLPELDQTEYLRLWINELPFIQRDSQIREQGLFSLTQARDLYSKSYRLETLLGDPRFHRESTRDYAIETATQVDRIYLWTWRWLTEPSDNTRHQLKQTLRSFDFTSAIKKMTFEDYQMLSNSLSWIALFQPLMATPIAEYLKRFFIRECEFFPSLKYERLCLEWMKSGGSETSRTALQNHPLHCDSNLKIFELVKSWKAQIDAKSNDQFPEDHLVFNPNSHQIWFGKEQLVSPPLVRVMSHLFKSKVMHFSEALSLGFHIGKFEPDVHVVKIHNLLNRLKKILPRDSRVFAKESVIYWEGDASQIHELSPLPLQHLLFEDAFELCKREPPKREFAPSVHPRAVLMKAEGTNIFTRPELQDLLQMSKSSTIRWIEKWHDLGLIYPTGKGRAIRYQIKFSDDEPNSGSN